MTTVDLITELFCQVDERMLHMSKHRQAKLYPSEVVTPALLYILELFPINFCPKYVH